ncbi:alpha/beta fold hydrolase [Pseudonocardia charpentierae]|uniref:Alpha/beta fold hydrolase n=1 Tax=Pseudonocardia charpentierae TaxID=3075545 RepID=A0ABU2NGM9_9PSEU|nr:alpha/beta fold hydrolase [Pseudonocardia sp. DSM 45834]MDT0353111.1 alpha/beta fold hydrolase [Pseudonocardia sp. DSM 45834]
MPQIDLGPDFECGSLIAPENRAKPDGRTVRIPVARAKATSSNPAPDPLVYLAGGPGGTGLASAVARVRAGWNADRDVIFIDQRGALKAQPLLACPEIDAFYAVAVTLAPTGPEFAARSAAATQACHDRLMAEGWDLSAYNTTENAADVADLRVALGLPEWNLYGVSYGTDLVLQTLRDHPDGIRSVVLDSVVPPQLNLLDGFWPNAAAGYRALFDGCAADAACHTAFPDVESEFRTLVNQLTAQPRTIPITDPTSGQNINVVFDGYTLANLIVLGSLSPGDLSTVPAWVHNLATGDGTQAAAALLDTRPPAGLTGYGLQFGVVCREWAPFTSPDRVQAEAKKALPDFPDAVLALVPQVPTIFRDCGIWNVPPADASLRTQTRSNVPALLLTGSFDAITPANWAEAAASGLANSRVLVFPGAAHDVLIWSPDCAVTIMRNFLNQPQSAYDDSCLRSVTAPPFKTA